VRRDATGRALTAAKAASARQIHAGEHAEAKLGCSHLHISPQAYTTPLKHEPEMHDGVSVLGVPGRP